MVKPRGKILRDSEVSARDLSFKPWHALIEADLAKFKSHGSTWMLEDGFPFY
jgi:hypothetical protein